MLSDWICFCSSPWLPIRNIRALYSFSSATAKPIMSMLPHDDYIAITDYVQKQPHVMLYQEAVLKNYAIRLMALHWKKVLQNIVTSLLWCIKKEF